jgi:formylmethanofuran dehydrogenase subunit B
MNCITGISLEKAAVPMFLPTDHEAIQVALGSIGLVLPDQSKIVRIQNTLHIDEVEVSAAYLEEVNQRPDLKVLQGPNPMAFDLQDNLLPLNIHGVRKGDL